MSSIRSESSVSFLGFFFFEVYGFHLFTFPYLWLLMMEFLPFFFLSSFKNFVHFISRRECDFMLLCNLASNPKACVLFIKLNVRWIDISEEF